MRTTNVLGCVFVVLALTGCTASATSPVAFTPDPSTPAPTSPAASTQAPTPTSVVPVAPALSHEAAWIACQTEMLKHPSAQQRDDWDPITAATFTESAGVITIDFRVRNGETLNADGTTTPIRPQAICVVSGTSEAPVVESANVYDRG